ncbi:hypothetical protein [Vibrio phage vB_ValA_R15Z]|uniref:Uncharacterized protein n=1 Tax=Vibrio phage vB_ValA_R15Z TaxID=3044218 RepID=A0AA49X729_9CAUD|nr:hypothetical protein [Vibrio phage vB_ValA_R15Z]
MASSPDIPEAKTPAKKPERQVDVEPEDIQLGTEDTGDVSQGRKRLRRPRTATGTGLNV